MPLLTDASEHCLPCQQAQVGIRRVLPRGLGTSGVVIVGDSPWLDEVRAGFPFAGPSGYLLDRLIRACGREPDEFLITNTMWCKPPMLGWTDKPMAYGALAACRAHLDELLERAKPRCIVPMGNVALRRTCDVTGIESHHGYLHETPYGPAVPTFHPSYLIRGMSEVEGDKSRNLRYFPVVVYALKRALEVASGKFQWLPVEYLLDPRLDEARAYVERCRGRQFVDIAQAGDASVYNFSCSNITQSNNSFGSQLVRGPPRMAPEGGAGVTGLARPSPGSRIPLVFLDLETPESAAVEGQEDEGEVVRSSRLKLAGPIIRVSLSLWPGTAVSVPWQEPFITWTKEVVNRADSLAAWNGYDADFPRLVAEGVIGGQSMDAGPRGRGTPNLLDPMWAWHFLQSDLPKALGFVAPFFYDGPAWKHLGSEDPAFYNAADSDVGLRCLIGIRQALVKQGRWTRWLRHCVQTWPVLSRMSEIGVLVDREAQSAFQAKLKLEHAAALATLQTVVPEAVKPVKRWKRPPKDMAGVRKVASPLGEEQGLLELEKPNEN